MPLLPCLGIYLNLLLCVVGTNANAWIIFGVFEAVGLLFYVFYGYHNSKLGKRMATVNDSLTDCS